MIILVKYNGITDYVQKVIADSTMGAGFLSKYPSRRLIFLLCNYPSNPLWISKNTHEWARLCVLCATKAI